MPPFGSGILQLDEEHVRRGVTGVLSVMLLSWQPADRSPFQLHLPADLPADETPGECAQVYISLCGCWSSVVWSPTICVFQHPHSFVLENHSVVLRMGVHGIQAHASRTAELLLASL
jgi:hypothetical protein